MSNLSPSIALKNAVSSLRTVGTVFAIIGAVGAFFVMSTSNKLAQMEAGASVSLFLVAPGVVYHLAAYFIRRHDVKMALLARRTALLQSAAGVLGILALILTDRTGPPLLLVGAVPTLFFIPALLAQSYEITKALEALRSIPETQRGFEVLAVLPIEEEADPVNAPPDEPK